MKTIIVGKKEGQEDTELFWFGEMITAASIQGTLAYLRDTHKNDDKYDRIEIAISDQETT